MGTCGIAAGAQDVYDAICDELKKRNIEDVVVAQTGCIGFCAQEPLAEVNLPGSQKVLYGHVDPEKAREIMDNMKFDFNCQYEEKDSIGKRYRRQDAIGTPFCITIDHDTLNDNTVTIRYRDTLQQERVAIDRLPEIMGDKVSLKGLLRML